MKSCMNMVVIQIQESVQENGGEKYSEIARLRYWHATFLIYSLYVQYLQIAKRIKQKQFKRKLERRINSTIRQE